MKDDAVVDGDGWVEDFTEDALAEARIDVGFAGAFAELAAGLCTSCCEVLHKDTHIRNVFPIEYNHREPCR